MTKIAILASANMMPGADLARGDQFELTEQMGKIAPAFAALGMDTQVLQWNSASMHAQDYDAVLPLFVWDYFEDDNVTAFMAQMKKVAAKTQLFNPVSLLAWNTNKAYLDVLGARGAPIIPARTVPLATPENILKACEDFDCDKLVIKPLVGGGAWRQALYVRGEALPSAAQLPPAEAILQPFLPSVLTEGEYSFIYFGGQFSHALNKRPKAGDYRIQSVYGGREQGYVPSEAERTQARAILELVDEMPLYARVDLLRGTDGTLKLIELEMVEPYLYLTFAQGAGADNHGAQNLARALKARLG